MAAVDRLEGFTLMLDGRPSIPEFRELLHFPGKKVRGGGEDSICVMRIIFVVRAVHMDSPCSANAVADKSRPFNRGRLFAYRS